MGFQVFWDVILCQWARCSSESAGSNHPATASHCTVPQSAATLLIDLKIVQNNKYFI